MVSVLGFIKLVRFDKTRFWIPKEVANAKDTHDASNQFIGGMEITGNGGPERYIRDSAQNTYSVDLGTNRMIAVPTRTTGNR